MRARLAVLTLALVACRQHHVITTTTTLVDPGAEPRRKLAYTPVATDRVVRFADAFDGATTLWFDARWRTAADGTASLTVVGTGADGKSDTDEISAKFKGATATTKIGPAGFGAIRRDGINLMPSPENALVSSGVPLPADAVGLGARWRTVETGEFQRTWDYTLTRLVGQELDVHVALVSPGSLMSVSLDGDVTVDLSDPLARTLKEVQTRTVHLDGGAQSMSDTLTVERK
jgi:hypothetical protein